MLAIWLHGHKCQIFIKDCRVDDMIRTFNSMFRSMKSNNIYNEILN
jgi:hypothetical protein